MKRILVVGPSKNTRGGITSVINAHQNTDVWENWNCEWIPTYIDKNVLQKILFFFIGFLKFIILVPYSKLVHIHLSEPSSAKRKNIFLTISKLFGKKTILHFHAFSPETTILGKYKLLYKNMFNKADVVIALSRYWQIQLNSIVDERKIKIIHNPCPQIKLIKDHPKNNTILFAGTLNRRKGYLDLIYAFSIIAKKYPEWILVFAGNGELDKAKKIAEELNILDQVDFSGWVYGMQKDDLFRSSSIFCLPSYAEGFPMAVLDAWAYGLPVITTPVGGLPDILKNGENALVFEPGDINDLAKKLEILISSIELRARLSEESLKLSCGIFNVNNIATKLDELYLSLSM